MLEEHLQDRAACTLLEEEVLSSAGSVSVRRYRKCEFLGEGGFARVYRLEDLESQQDFAVKVVPKLSLVKPNNKRKLQNEIKIHKSLAHPFVVGFSHYFEDYENVYIVLELCPRQTLAHLLKQQKRLTEVQARTFFIAAVTAVQHLHVNSILHRDIKPSNLFLTQDLGVKLGDFGLACKLEHRHQRRHSVCGTPNYVAPEVLSPATGHGYEADVWSLGVLLYTLLVGVPPFEALDVKQVYRRIRRGHVSFPPGVSKTARALISAMLAPNPEERLTLAQVLEHSFCTAQVTREPRRSRFNLQHPVFIEKWVDHSDRYGLGYILSNGQAGALFKDKTALLESSGSLQYFYKTQAPVKFARAQCPEALEKKTRLLAQFAAELDLQSDENLSPADNIYLKRWTQSKHAVVFVLSNQVLQFVFNDQSELILEEALEIVNYTDTRGRLLCLPQAAAYKRTDSDLPVKLLLAKTLAKRCHTRN